MKNPARFFLHLFLAVTFLSFPCPVFQSTALAADKPVADITRTLNFHEGYSATPNPDKNYEAFDFEADLGPIAGITKQTLDRAFDGASDADIMPGSNTVTLGSLSNSVTTGLQSMIPQAPGGSGSSNTFGPQATANTTLASQSAVSPQNLTVTQSGQTAVLQITKPVVPPGAVVIAIPQETPAAVTTPEATTGTTVVVTPEQAAQGQMISIQVPGGSGGGTSTQNLTARDLNSGSGTPTNIPYTEGLKLGAKINAGVFNAGDANKEFRSAVDIRWSSTPVSVSAQQTLDRVPIGKLRAHTTKFEFKRQLGWGLHLKLSLEWMNKWFNDIAEYSPSDVDMNIDDKTIEKLGPTVVNHADVIDPFPINPVALVGNIAAKLGAKGMKVVAAKTLGEKIFGKLSIGVTAEQNTYDRALEVTLSATGTDIEGNTVSLLAFGEDGSTTIRMDQETNEYPLFVAIPKEMKPVKQVTVKIADAVYKYKEGGNVALGVSCYGISFPTNTGRLTSWIGKIFNEDHVISTGDKPDFTVPIEPMVQVPFHGIVETGDPRTGLEGATVNLMKENRVFMTATTHADGRFYGDFTVLGSETAGMLALPMQAVKQGYPIQESIKAPDNFVKTDDGYRIFLPPDLANSMSVYGPVTDINDKPIAGAEVILSGVEQQMVVSQANGAYQFNQVPRCDQFSLSVNKSGYYFAPVTYNRQSNQAGILVPLKAAIAQQSRKSIKLALMPINGVPFPMFVNVTHADGSNYTHAQKDGAFFIGVNGMSDTLTLSQEGYGYTFTPPSVTAQFSGDLSDTEEKSFNVTALPIGSHSVTLAAGSATIETGGAHFNDSRTEETGRATAQVVDAVNRPVANVSVRFTDTGDDAHTGLAFANEQNGNGYAFTDATGTAAVNFTAHGLGKITVLATALDHFMATGGDEVKSNSVELTAVANTRSQNPKKPTASVTASAEEKAITSQGGGVKIETGGKIKFQFSSVLGNSPAGGAPVPGDSFTGFKLVFYRFNQKIGEEVYASTPWPSVIREFSEYGTYKISFQVKEKYYENEIWSDPAEATFEVEELRPPEVTLTIPNTTGTVNLPVDWSFGVLGYATLKNIILQFGDNKMDINLDAGLLTGKKTWSGSYFHTYDAEGTYTVLLRATDVNNKTAETTKTVTIGSIAALNDHTAPTGTVSINSGAATTASRTVVLHITGSDNNGGAGVFRMRLSNDGATWNNWNYVSWPDDRPLPSVTMDYAWQVSDSGGNKTVYVQLKDAAENVSTTFSDSITYANAVSVSGASGDGSSPGIYPGNDQSMYTWDHQAPTGSISVPAVNGATASVALTMQDGGTAPHPRMCFSANGSTWTAWEEFVSSKDIGLDSGQAKVYVKYVDGVGNVSTAYSADIPAQGNAPVAPAEAPAAQAEVPPAGMMGPPVGDAMVQDPMAPVEPVVPQTPAEPGADWTVEKLGLSQKPMIGKKMFIMVGLKAVKGSGKGSADVIFRPEGGMAETKRVPLDGKTKEDIRFDWAPSNAGKTELFIEVRSDGDPDPANNSTREMIDVEEGTGKSKRVSESEQNVANAVSGDAAVKEIQTGREIRAGKPSKVEIKLENLSKKEISDCELTLSDDRGFRQQERVSFKKKGKEKIKMEYVPSVGGRGVLKAVLACGEDADLSNNEMTKDIEVLEDEKMGGFPAVPGEAAERRQKGKLGEMLEKEGLPGEERR